MFKVYWLIVLYNNIYLLQFLLQKNKNIYKWSTQWTNLGSFEKRHEYELEWVTLLKFERERIRFLVVASNTEWN